jgi:hypothetical protein
MEQEKQLFNDIDELLQSQANNFVLYPKDTTWEEIKTELHGNTKWPALGVIFMCIVVALTISTALNYPPEPILAKYKTQEVSNLAVKDDASKNKKNTNSFLQQLNTEANKETFLNIAASKNEDVNSNILIPVNENEPTNQQDLFHKNTVKENLAQVVISNKTNIHEPVNVANNLINAFEEKIVQNINTATSNETQKLNINFLGNENNNPEALDYLNEFESNKYIKPKKPSKWQYQVYITPSISDRILYDDKTRIYYTNPANSQNLNKNINDFIQHKPAMGTEIGASFLYKFGKNIHLKTGVQFNIRQYFIDAYRGFNTATVAFVNNSALDSVNLVSLFSNNSNGYRAELNNKLYQISVPIGLQWDFISSKNFGINVAATIQPTFTLNKNVYLVSTDYKYFADGESFFRNINLNSAFELNFTFKNGKKQWFFGPQIRYQHLPTFNKIYPIKEFRLDYGLKFGVTAPL